MNPDLWEDNYEEENSNGPSQDDDDYEYGDSSEEETWNDY